MKTLLAILAIKLCELIGLAVLMGLLIYFFPVPPYIFTPPDAGLSLIEALLSGLGFSLMFNLFSGYPLVSGVFLGLFGGSTDTARQRAFLAAGMSLAYTGAWLLLLFLPNSDQLHYTVPIAWAAFGFMSFWLTLSFLKPRANTDADRKE